MITPSLVQAEYKELLNRQVRQAAADASSSSAAAAAVADDAFLQSECRRWNVDCVPAARGVLLGGAPIMAMLLPHIIPC